MCDGVYYFLTSSFYLSYFSLVPLGIRTRHVPLSRFWTHIDHAIGLAAFAVDHCAPVVCACLGCVLGTLWTGYECVFARERVYTGVALILQSPFPYCRSLSPPSIGWGFAHGCMALLFLLPMFVVVVGGGRAVCVWLLIVLLSPLLEAPSGGSLLYALLICGGVAAAKATGQGLYSLLWYCAYGCMFGLAFMVGGIAIDYFHGTSAAMSHEWSARLIVAGIVLVANVSAFKIALRALTPHVKHPIRGSAALSMLVYAYALLEYVKGIEEHFSDGVRVSQAFCVQVRVYACVHCCMGLHEEYAL